eukprot:11337103-Alexandrium_andersonii.AAC.1
MRTPRTKHDVCAFVPLALLVGGGRVAASNTQLAPLLRRCRAQFCVRKLRLDRALSPLERAKRNALHITNVHSVESRLNIRSAG